MPTRGGLATQKETKTVYNKDKEINKQSKVPLLVAVLLLLFFIMSVFYVYTAIAVRKAIAEAGFPAVKSHVWRRSPLQFHFLHRRYRVCRR